MFYALRSTFNLIFLISAGFFLQTLFQLSVYGILPRNLVGLRGVVFSPILHGNWQHLATNCISLISIAPFFFFVAKSEKSNLINLWFLSGLGTWIIGRSQSVHIGASGLIFAMIGYLMGVGLFRRNFKSIFISFVAFSLYGGALWGVLPTQSFVSWEGHLAGFVAGLLVARSK